MSDTADRDAAPAAAEGASWFPTWAAGHAGLHCGACITWGGLALCAAREGERRGLAARPAPAVAPREGELKRLIDAVVMVLWLHDRTPGRRSQRMATALNGLLAALQPFLPDRSAAAREAARGEAAD